jgi:hypothetical protein
MMDFFAVTYPTFVGNQQARSKNGSASPSALILREKSGIASDMPT